MEPNIDYYHPWHKCRKHCLPHTYSQTKWPWLQQKMHSSEWGLWKPMMRGNRRLSNKKSIMISCVVLCFQGICFLRDFFLSFIYNNLAQINTIQIVCYDKMRLLSFSSFSYYFGRVIKKSFDKCFKISFWRLV